MRSVAGCHTGRRLLFQWASTLGNTTDSAAALSTQQTSDGGYIVVGFPGGALGGLGLLKYDSAGKLQWLQRAEGINLYGQSVQQTTDGGYIVAGSAQIGTTTYNATLLKFDGLGNLQWAQLATGGNFDQGNAVRQTADGGYILAGTTDNRSGEKDVLLAKYDSTGTLQWVRTTDGGANDTADSVQQTSDGGYIVSGQTDSFGTGQQLLLLKYDSAGTLQWAKSGIGSNSSTSVEQTVDGGYLVAGSTASFGEGGSDVLLIRTDPNGDVASCPIWPTVTLSAGTSFTSSPRSYVVDSPTFSVGTPTLSAAAAALTSTNICP